MYRRLIAPLCLLLASVFVTTAVAGADHEDQIDFYDLSLTDADYDTFVERINATLRNTQVQGVRIGAGNITLTLDQGEVVITPPPGPLREVRTWPAQATGDITPEQAARLAQRVRRATIRALVTQISNEIEMEEEDSRNIIAILVGLTPGTMQFEIQVGTSKIVDEAGNTLSTAVTRVMVPPEQMWPDVRGVDEVSFTGEDGNLVITTNRGEVTLGAAGDQWVLEQTTGDVPPRLAEAIVDRMNSALVPYLEQQSVIENANETVTVTIKRVYPDGTVTIEVYEEPIDDDEEIETFGEEGNDPNEGEGDDGGDGEGGEEEI